MNKEELDLLVLHGLTSMYHSMHIINVIEDTFIEYNAIGYVHNIYNNEIKASEMVKSVILKLAVPEMIEPALEFTKIDTLASRMLGKNILSGDFISNRVGWIRAQFTPLDYTEEGNLLHVIFTTRRINDEKIKEQMLLKMSNTDEMTMLANRRAFDAFMESYKSETELGDFTVVSLDVNGLKLVNDTLGHQAGDELLKLSADAIRSVFGKYGDTYRTGGDEFIAIIHADEDKVSKIKKDFNKYLKQLNGEYIDSVSISFGAALAINHKGKTMEQLWKEADIEMYKAKEAYYHEMGLKRRTI